MIKIEYGGFACLVAMLLLTASCASQKSGVFNKTEDLPKQMLDRQLLVTLPESLKTNWQAISKDLGNTHKIEQSGEFPLPSIGVDCLVYKIPPRQDLDSVLQKLRADSRVVLAQKNQVFSGIQSGESDEYAGISYSPKLIRADAAHHFATGKGVSIAIVDTGAEKDHPDLKGQVAKTANFVDGGDRSFTRDQHGTAVVGVIGARANDGIGIYGIAPDAKLSVLKACWYPETSESGAKCSSWSLAKAVDAAITNGAQIINLSLAGPEDELLTKLLKAAHQRNVNVVAAALEKQEQPGFPADLPEVVPVISAGPEGEVNQPVWLTTLPQVAVAPGVEILTTVPKEGYDFVSGSSLATAHVSGAIALLLELKPTLSANEIKHLLVKASMEKAGNPLRIIDVCALLQQVDDKVSC